MKVHVIKEKTIRSYCKDQARAKSSFEGWLAKVAEADWDEPEHIMQTFGTTDFLGKSSSRIVFDIGGNNYRMICKYNFGAKEIHLFICWIGTHAEYDRLCSAKEQYTVWIY